MYKVKTIKGNIELADTLGVSLRTIYRWKKSGLLNSSVIIKIGRIIIYDLEKVINNLQQTPVRRGRPKNK